MTTYPEYIAAALRKAQYERMEDGEWYVSIPGFERLWATGPSVEETRAQLIETLAEWMSVHARIGLTRLPTVDGIDLYDLPQRVDD
jgi:predicted RNase H-like HicB family nuclease